MARIRIRCSFAVLAALGSIALADNMYAVDSSTDRLYVFDSVTGKTITALGLLDDDPDRYVTPVSMAVTGDRSAIFIINNTPQGLGLTPCRPDLNDDGRLDIFDFLAFQNEFEHGC